MKNQFIWSLIMWSLILSAIPWSSIFNLAIQLVLYIIKKSSDHKEAEEAFLKFVSEIEQRDVPVKIHDKYREQIAAIRERLSKQESK